MMTHEPDEEFPTLNASVMTKLIDNPDTKMRELANYVDNLQVKQGSVSTISPNQTMTNGIILDIAQPTAKLSEKLESLSRMST